MKLNNKNNGFTLIELIIVIVILGVLSVIAAPQFLNLSSDTKIAALRSLGGQFNSLTKMVQMKATVKGLSPAEVNPGGIQTDFVIDFGFGSVELYYASLCPESEGEGGSKLTMLDFFDISDDFQTRIDNQYTLIGYDIPTSGTPTTEGCYLIYDSFKSPECLVEIVTTDC